MSQGTGMHESILVLKRHRGPKPPTRFVHLDRMPMDEDQLEDLHRCLSKCDEGTLNNGWGEVSKWSATRIETGNWTAGVWRSPKLAEAANGFASHDDLLTIGSTPGVHVRITLQELHAGFDRANADTPGSFPVLFSKSTEGQKSITSRPDEYRIPKDRDESLLRLNGETYPKADKLLQKAGYLLITHGQYTQTGRVTAVAGDEKYLGSGWMPVIGFSPAQAKAAAVFINATPGRLQLMRNPGRTVNYPRYNPADIGNLRIPDIKDSRVVNILTNCWEQTKDMVVPQFRDGECDVRRLWDEAVAEAMGWDADELASLRDLLNSEPHIRGLGYNQYADAEDIEPAQREKFQKLAEQWEEETFFLSRSDRAVAHPVHQEIINLGQPIVPLILERMRSRGGHWFEALQEITGEDPVSPADYGNIAAMQNAWLQWGEDRGYA